METVLMTGISGFVGSHLVEIRWRSRTENIEHTKDEIRRIDADKRI